ncbi:MAG TPA: antitoxin VapB family protein [Methanothrix sp.]|jgi:predicted CopG family antitoxin|nr:antitoxin VapB family protein [Methanothrix sp.]
MTTTIQVKDDVQQMLDRLKREIDAKSYDEVIRYLFKKAKRMDLSHFGSLPKLESFRRDEIDRLD